MIEAVLYTDPGCPWGYSANPALRVLEWRYGSQLDWKLVVIGLSESVGQYEAQGFTLRHAALAHTRFRSYGMPFSGHLKERLAYTARACRAICAARILQPGSEWRVLRALQLAAFSTAALLDDDAQIAAALAELPGVDGERIVAMLDDDAVTATYELEKAMSREAAGTPAELQGKTSTSDGPVRYTAPSVTFHKDGTSLVAGGFQPIEAYDVLLANLDPTLDRKSPPSSPLPILEHFPDGLTTQEVAALLVDGNDAPDRAAAERALIELAVEGRAARMPLGDDALWQSAS